MSNSISGNNSKKQSSNHNRAYPNFFFDRIELEDLAIEDVEGFDKFFSKGDEKNSNPTLSGSSSQVSSNNSNPTDQLSSIPEETQKKLLEILQKLEPPLNLFQTEENPGLTPNDSEDSIPDIDFPPDVWFNYDDNKTDEYPPIPDIYRPEEHHSEIDLVHEGLYNAGTPNEMHIISYTFKDGSRFIISDRRDNVWDQIAVDIMVAIETSFFSNDHNRSIASLDINHRVSDDSVNFITAFRSIFDNDFPLLKDGFNFELDEQNPHINLIDLMSINNNYYYLLKKYLYENGKPPEYEKATYIDFYIAAQDFVSNVNKSGGLNGESITIADIPNCYENKIPNLTNEDVYMAYTLDIIEELAEKFSPTQKTEQIYYVNSEDDIIQNNAIPGTVWIIGTEDESKTVRIYYPDGTFRNFYLSFSPKAQELIESGAHNIMTDNEFRIKLKNIFHALYDLEFTKF